MVITAALEAESGSDIWRTAAKMDGEIKRRKLVSPRQAIETCKLRKKEKAKTLRERKVPDLEMRYVQADVPRCSVGGRVANASGVGRA